MDVVVIGGGAAGMMAACTAAQYGASVTLLERNAFLGVKLNITGKGRCNLTNNCDVRELISAVLLYALQKTTVLRSMQTRLSR